MNRKRVRGCDGANMCLHRGPVPPAKRTHERWSMDFVHDALFDGRPFRILTVVDQYSRQGPVLEPAFTHSGRSVAAALERMVGELGAPVSIIVDHGTEFMPKALEEWAWQRGIKLDFIRPGKPNENAHIESFNGHLRDECLNVNQFTSLDDTRHKIEAWRQDYNHARPHSSLRNLTPHEFARQGSKNGSVKAAISRFELSQNGTKVETLETQALTRPRNRGNSNSTYTLANTLYEILKPHPMRFKNLIPFLMR